MMLSIGVLTFVTLQRLAELVIARAHTKALLAKGAYEVGAEHYPVMVAIHTAWLAGLWVLAPTITPSLTLLAVFGLLQLGRFWVLATLGERWTTRIMILPGAPLVTKGPYHFLAHPNYAIVTAEIAVLPFAFGLTGFSVLFTALNAAILYVRISAENAALEAGTAGNDNGLSA
jgi:methyltransferase